MKKVSVIVPVYNTERYLRNCVDSILAQTYDNIEVVLVNDGSTDLSLEICKDYQMRFSNVFLLNKSNTGQADSRYLGFKKSTGDYIYCVDSDDSIEKDAIEHLVSGLERSDSDMFFSRFRLVDETNKVIKESGRYNVNSISERHCILYDALCAVNIKASLCIKLCRREIWERCYTEDVRKVHFNEDYLLTVLFANVSKKVGFSNKVIYNALKREGSISRNVRPEMLLGHDQYYLIIRNTIDFENDTIKKGYYLGYAKNIIYCMLLIASRVKRYSDYRLLYIMIPRDSIYLSREYKKAIRLCSIKYMLLDFLSRSPRLFYNISGLLTSIYNH